MFTWTSKHLSAAALAALTLLGGCDAGFFVSAPTSMSVAKGSVVVTGPPGFCIDESASHNADTGAFVLLGSCASITGSLDAGKPQIRALLTAAVSAGSNGPTVRGSMNQLSAFFRSANGRKALSRSGNAATVRVLGTSHTDGVMILHVRDTSPFPGQAVTPGYWRALFDLNGHIVTLSVVGVAQAPYPEAAGLQVLETFVATVRAASPAPKATPGAATGG